MGRLIEIFALTLSEARRVFVEGSKFTASTVLFSHNFRNLLSRNMGLFSISPPGFGIRTVFLGLLMTRRNLNCHSALLGLT